MCEWQSPRVGVVRDTVYIDGGILSWQQGLADGSYAGLFSDDNPLGLVYALNFSLPFQTTQDFNQTALFTNMTKSSAGGAANNIGPDYIDGVMFANDYEWWTYGGLVTSTASYSAPGANSVALYELYTTAPGTLFNQGFILSDLPANITRYVSYGAGVSVPSENLGFYFGGARSSSGGEIFYDPANETVNADQIASSLIELNITLIPQGGGQWNNYTLPPTVTSRVSGELVWVPVGQNGALIAVGGVTEIVWETLDISISAADADTIAAESQAYMEIVAVYDIATKVWYQQKTTGPYPIGLAQGCTVVASAQDGSSHNIYWYGGFDGTHPSDPFSDEVWVLSIPSFTWVLLSQGVVSHARAGHRCVKPYPDQMFVIGGYTTEVGTGYNCVEGGIIQSFNLSSGQWLDSYDPKVYSSYQVPDLVVSKIGGSGSGGANTTVPASTNSSLASLLAAPYNSSKITAWYPYHEAVQTSSVPSPTSKSSGTPKYLAPVLAVILGLFFITLVVLGILLWRRRRYLSTHPNTGHSDSGTMNFQSRVSNWLRRTPSVVKSPTVTSTDEQITSGYKYDFLHNQLPEAGGIQVHEMDDTSSPAELRGTVLRDTALTETIMSQTGLVPISQVQELSSQTEKTTPRPISTGSLPRADSPTGAGSITSDFEPGHVRSASDATVSADGDDLASAEAGVNQPAAAGGETATSPGQRAGAVSPMTPSEVGVATSGDYLNKGSEPGQESQTTSNRRTSNFSEDLDERRGTK